MTSKLTHRRYANRPALRREWRGLTVWLSLLLLLLAFPVLGHTPSAEATAAPAEPAATALEISRKASGPPA